VPLVHCLNPTAYLSIVSDHAHPLYGHHVPILWWLLPVGHCTMSQSLNHFKLVSWTWLF